MHLVVSILNFKAYMFLQFLHFLFCIATALVKALIILTKNTKIAFNCLLNSSFTI